jgi:hypothetical protein
MPVYDRLLAIAIGLPDLAGDPTCSVLTTTKHKKQKQAMIVVGRWLLAVRQN